MSENGSPVVERETLTDAERNDRHRREKNRELAEINRRIWSLEEEITDAKDDLKEMRDRLKRREEERDEIHHHLADIENGCYQPGLFQQNDKPHPDLNGPDADLSGATQRARQQLGDVGAIAPLAELIKHGLTEKQVEMLEGSALATERKLKTVADLEAAIRGDEWWHKKIRGFGVDKVDKVIDALIAYRAKYPVVSEEESEDVE